MTVLLYALTCLFFASAWYLSARYHIYMLQLEAYLPKAYGHFVFRKTGAFHLRALIPLVISGVLLIFSSPWLWVVGDVLIGLHAVFYIPKKEKKPFVCTMRATRLFVTTALLTAVFAVFGFVCHALYLLPLSLALVPVFVWCARYINVPAENAVRRKYINEAKAIIRARKNSLTVIGITGSYGKTSTKYFLNEMLKSKYNVLMTPGSYNTTMGVVKVIREMLKPYHDVFICEMGARNVGEIKEICDIVLPAHGIITSVGPQHLETFLTVDNVRKTKFELADAVPDGGVVALCGDNAEIRKMPKKDGYVYYGTEEVNDVVSKNMALSANGMRFDVTYGKNTFHVTSKLIGRHNVQNLTGAMAMSLALGVSENDIVKACMRMEAVPHRLQVLSGKRNITVIDDSFNSNPEGCIGAVETLGAFDGKKVLVSPGLIDLGPAAERYNTAFGKYAADVCDDIFIVGKENREYIEKGIRQSSFDSSHIHFVASPNEAVSLVTAMYPLDKVAVLLENDLPDNFQ